MFRFRFLVAALVLSLVFACGSKKTTQSSSQDGNLQPSTSMEVRGVDSGKSNFSKYYQYVSIDGQNIADRVFFEFDSSTLNQEAKTVLDSQISVLKANSKIKLVTEGYCDERGGRDYNLALGEKRASAVKSYLTKNGVEANRISVISYGKEKPLVLGSGDEVYQQNRAAVSVFKQK